MSNTNYLVACHESDSEPNIGFIVPEAATPLVPRRGAYPQRRSIATWLNKGHTMTPPNWAQGSWFFTRVTSTTFFTTLETLETLNGTEWTTIQCANVWDFFGKIGYDYKKKKYTHPLDTITLIGYNTFT